MSYHLTLMGYHLKFVVHTCESCGELFEKAAVSLAKQCDPCKRSFAKQSMEWKRRDIKRENKE